MTCLYCSRPIAPPRLIGPTCARNPDALLTALVRAWDRGLLVARPAGDRHGMIELTLTEECK